MVQADVGANRSLSLTSGHRRSALRLDHLASLCFLLKLLLERLELFSSGATARVGDSGRSHGPV